MARWAIGPAYCCLHIWIIKTIPVFVDKIKIKNDISLIKKNKKKMTPNAEENNINN